MREKIMKQYSLLFLFSIFSIFGRDVILEFKGAYFLPVNSSFKDLYKGSALYGPELTVQLGSTNKHWYGFASLDYYKQKGRYLTVADSTKIKMLPLAFGLKYFIPIRDRADFYFGLGFQPAHIKRQSRHVLVTAKESQWAYGLIGKVGSYIHLPHNFLLDLFVDYSFLKTSGQSIVLPSNPNISGMIFGAGLGYKF